MVISDDFLHILKIKNFFSWIHQNYLVALMWFKIYMPVFNPNLSVVEVIPEAHNHVARQHMNIYRQHTFFAGNVPFTKIKLYIDMWTFN